MENEKKYSLVFFDLDGTLLTDKKEILTENLNEINRIEKLGVKTVLCSGRQVNAVKRFKIARNISISNLY